MAALHTVSMGAMLTRRVAMCTAPHWPKPDRRRTAKRADEGTQHSSGHCNHRRKYEKAKAWLRNSPPPSHKVNS
jgi:hypothetical protein